MSEQIAMQTKWLELVQEEIVEPDRRIVDPHHHLWGEGGPLPYSLDDLWGDTGSGHRVEKTVFMECGASYKKDGPEHLRPIGEVEFVTEAAGQSRQNSNGRAEIAGCANNALDPEDVPEIGPRKIRVGNGPSGVAEEGVRIGIVGEKVVGVDVQNGVLVGGKPEMVIHGLRTVVHPGDREADRAGVAAAVPVGHRVVERVTRRLAAVVRVLE